MKKKKKRKKEKKHSTETIAVRRRSCLASTRRLASYGSAPRRERDQIVRKS
jgi:hypothetical protein